jgi:hypothetical protein
VKKVKPWVQVSSSPLGKYSTLPSVPNAGQTGLSVYQDSYLWLRNHRQDMIVPMMYFRDNLFYPFVSHWKQNRNGRLLVAGIGAYRLMKTDANWSLQTLTGQIDYLRKENVDGLAFFRAGQVFANYKGLYDVLADKYFKYPALLPPLTWLDNNAPPAPQDITVRRNGNVLHLSWDVTGDTEPLTYTVYAAEADMVSTSDAVNILSTGLRNNEAYFLIDEPEKEQGFTFRVTASNRYHQESAPSEEIFYYVSRYTK